MNTTTSRSRAAQSGIASRHAPYFVQSQFVGSELRGRSRIDVFTQICAGKRVLHVGCTDWPITDLGHSLHLQLDRVCQLDGFDTHDEAFPGMRPHLAGQLYARWQDLPGGYDIVLVPEVLEHVPDVADFLRRLDDLQAGAYVITVPDAYSCCNRHFEYAQQDAVFTEVVHPDHNCWYTPYTLRNVIRKYTDWQLDGLWFFNSISLLAIARRTTSAR
jgi:hypothetical protein